MDFFNHTVLKDTKFYDSVKIYRTLVILRKTVRETARQGKM
jgi:hypothetical protein